MIPSSTERNGFPPPSENTSNCLFYTSLLCAKPDACYLCFLSVHYLICHPAQGGKEQAPQLTPAGQAQIFLLRSMPLMPPLPRAQLQGVRKLDGRRCGAVWWP